MSNIAMPQNATAEEILEHFSDPEHYPDELLVPYREFEVGNVLRSSR